MSYPNGEVPASDLAPLDEQPAAQLRTDAAAAWNRARADVKARTGIVLRVRGWFRTWAEQVTFFHRAYTPTRAGGTDPRWFAGVRYARRPGKAAAAIPGTSNHGYGTTVDVEDYGGVGNFEHPRRVATFPILAEHGWTDDEGRGPIREPWHLTYDRTRDRHINDPAPAPPPVPEEEDLDMLIIRRKRDGAAFIVLGGRGCRIATGADLAAYGQEVATVNLSDASYDLAERRYLLGA